MHVEIGVGVLQVHVVPGFHRDVGLVLAGSVRAEFLPFALGGHVDVLADFNKVDADLGDGFDELGEELLGLTRYKVTICMPLLSMRDMWVGGMVLRISLRDGGATVFS